MTQMNFIELIPILIVTVLASVVQSTTGFGFAITMMSMLPHFMENYLMATALSGLGAIALSAMVTAKHIRQADFKMIMPVLVGYLGTSTVIIPLAKRFSGGVLTKALGILLVAVSIYFIFFNNKIKIKPTFTNGIIAGIIAGVGVGLFAIGGPPVVIYLLSAIDDKDIYRVSSLAYFTLSGIYATGLRVVNGIIDGQVMMIYVFMLAAIVLGGFIGEKIFNRINADRLKKIIYIFMAFSGVTLLV